MEAINSNKKQVLSLVQYVNMILVFDANTNRTIINFQYSPEDEAKYLQPKIWRYFTYFINIHLHT